MIEILSEPRAATKENVERKQARTDGEREEEEEEVVEVILLFANVNRTIVIVANIGSRG